VDGTVIRIFLSTSMCGQIQNGLRADLDPLGPRVEAVRNAGKEKYSWPIARVDNSILVRVQLARRQAISSRLSRPALLRSARPARSGCAIQSGTGDSR
jgi:hypothetical protein